MKKAKVLTVATNKGGVLKTSVTVNLAGIWAKQGKRVLIIDMDNQGNVLVSFGKNPDRYTETIYDVFVDGLAAEAAIVNVYENIDVLPANDDMRFAEFDILTSKRISRADYFILLKKAVQHLRRDYDIILVDSPPTLSLIAGNILTFCDYIMIPFQPEPYAKRGLIKMVEAVQTVETNPDLKMLGILPTLVKQNTNTHSKNLQEARQVCDQRGWKIFETVIPNSIRFADATENLHIPATLAIPNHEVVRLYFELVKEIEDEWQEKAEKVLTSSQRTTSSRKKKR